MFPIRAVVLLLVLDVAASAGEGPCASGLKPGKRPGPYSAVVSVGPHRGQSHCFICETADRPAVIVFARTLSAPLARLARGLDKALAEHKKAELRAWVTFLHDDQSAFDARVVAWSKKHALRNLPLAVFEDLDGPPAYKLTREADVTVLLYVKQKVVRNFAFRAGELTEARLADVLKAIPDLVKKK
jgi:hypothetical protein